MIDYCYWRWPQYGLVMSNFVSFWKSWLKNDKLYGYYRKNSNCSSITQWNKADFQHKIEELQAWNEIPENLIINFDQTHLLYVCTRKCTYHAQDASKVPLFFYENDINMFTNNIYNIKTIKNIKPDKTKTVP